jgi:ribosomal protein S18 acetylase RimI-like enzyme
MFESTQDLQRAKLWAEEFLGNNNVAKYHLNSETFVVAYKGAHGFSFVVKDEPFYGQLYGAGPFLDPRCTEFSVEFLEEISYENFVVRGGGFEFWELDTANSYGAIELLDSDEEIVNFIEANAPDSSVRPGNDEVIFWGGLRNPRGELVACAVVVKWQSGFHVVSSVATRTDKRGQGIGTSLSIGIASHARELGIALLGLGVRRDNATAKRIYEGSPSI